MPSFKLMLLQIGIVSKSHSELRDLTMNQFETIKDKLKTEITEAKQTGIQLSVTNDESTSTRNRRFMNINVHFGEIFKSLGSSKI